METQLLMGNEAIALGAVRAGVNLACGYPGTPSSEILETLAKIKTADLYCEWSVNEKVALEVASGAAIAGARVLVTMKQVGVNVAADPLLCTNYVGVKGAMVVVVADDPGPISSQTEQDTRHFAAFARLACFDPATPEEAYWLIGDAFAVSAYLGRPVIFRPTTRVCHSYAAIAPAENLPRSVPVGFTRDEGKWAIFPRQSFLNHQQIEKNLTQLGADFDTCRANQLRLTDSEYGVVGGGVAWQYLQEALAESRDADVAAKIAKWRQLKIGTLPVPEKMTVDFLRGAREILVVEELDAVLERELLQIAGRENFAVKIRGKLTGDLPVAGEYSTALLVSAIEKFGTRPTENRQKVSLVEADENRNNREKIAANPPPRAPTLCAGCPHRATFFALKTAARELRRDVVYCGDIGCYTLGNAAPLKTVDTCLCMGAGITQAQGIAKIDPQKTPIACIGDSTFFHSGITGLINAVYNRAEILIAILDNSTTAMTGGQPHPGTGKTLNGDLSPAIVIEKIVAAVGVNCAVVDAFDFETAKNYAREYLELTGTRALVFRGACVKFAEKRAPAKVIRDKCRACGACVRQLGCPALIQDETKIAKIIAGCTNCGLCRAVCPFAAIE